MLSHILRRRRRPKVQANRKTEPSRGSAIAAQQLRALIPYSTDPAWLEKMARDVESKAHRQSPLP